MVIPDLNPIVYAYAPDSPWHERAKAWWEDLLNSGESVGIPLIVRLGFIRLLGNPSIIDRPLPPGEALRITEEWFAVRAVQEIHPADRHYGILSDLVTGSHIVAKSINDAHLAALAIERRAEFHTNDNDFLRFKGLKVVLPFRQRSR